MKVAMITLRCRDGRCRGGVGIDMILPYCTHTLLKNINTSIPGVGEVVGYYCPSFSDVGVCDWDVIYVKEVD